MNNSTKRHGEGVNGEGSMDGRHEEGEEHDDGVEAVDAYGYEELVMDQHTQMFRDLKHIVLGEYFCIDSLSGNGDVFDWHDDDGFKFSMQEPLTMFLEREQVRALRVKGPPGGSASNVGGLYLYHNPTRLENEETTGMLPERGAGDRDG